tara:strand:- start:146 stop:358 length:213 start_codon:yes stop_codon:yes gene_type:complete
MKLSTQAIGALLMTVQRCLAEQEDITDLLSDWEIEVKDDEVWVMNPPTVRPSEPSEPGSNPLDRLPMFRT